MTKKELADCIQHQLTHHGYDIARGAAEDTAAQALTAEADPLTRLLDAALELGVSLKLDGVCHPNADATIREWAAEHTDQVYLYDSAASGTIWVDSQRGDLNIVTFRPAEPQVENVGGEWSPAQAVAS